MPVVTSIDEPNPNDTEEWCLTKKIVIKHSLTWAIEDFSKLLDEERIESPVFPSKDKEVGWKLILSCDKSKPEYMSRHPPKPNDDLKLYLKMMPSSACERATVICNVRLTKAKHKQLHSYDNIAIESKPSNSQPLKVFAREALVQELLPDDKLTIHFEMQRDDVLSKFSPSRSLPAVSYKMAEDMDVLLSSQMFTDLSIQVGTKEFKAHKAILAARSPVFNAMFSHDMLESQSNRVEVTDIESDVFGELLRFIYTEKTSLQSDSDEINEGENGKHMFAIGILEAAAKYQLEGLKIICEHDLNSRLSLDSVAEIMLSSDRCDSLWLKKRAIDFSISHRNELSERGVWKCLARSNPSLLAEIFASNWPSDN